MDSRWHLEMGLRALDRGLLDARGLAEALAELGDGRERGPEELWVRADRLTREQLASLSIPMAQRPDSHTVLERKPLPQRTPTASAIVRADTSPLERDTRPFEAPRRARDPYKRVATLGSGGMGQVHQCLDEDLGRAVAMKALRPELAADAQSARMLWREAQVTGSLEHPNILPVYDVGTHPEIGPYYVMRLIQQPTLGDVLVLLRQEDPDATRSYSLGRLLRMFIQICETVDYAHSRGVIHCDLKPGNILLGPFGEVLVVDWGMAYRVEEGMVYRGGTPGYMAPEQIDRANRTLDARSDVYALGAVLYEILCLQPAWRSSDTLPEGVAVRLEDLTPSPPSEVAPWRQIPGELDEIVMKALSRDREARFATAREMALALENFLEGTKEKERRRLRAQAATEEGDRLAESFREFVETRPERLAELRELAAQVAPWEPVEKKQALWDAEDRIAVTDALGIRTLQAAVASYESALDEVQAHAPARRGLALLYHAQMLQAKERGDELDRLYFEELAAQYDDGTLQKQLSADGALLLDCPDATVTLAAVEEEQRRLAPGAAKSLPNRARVPLAPGRWLITVERGEMRARVPLVIAPGAEAKLAIDFHAIGAPGPHEVLVAGAAPFFIDVFPVDFKEYLRFLASLDADAALAHLPRTRDGQELWTRDGAPARVGLLGSPPETLLALPAFGVSAISAEAYAAWRAEATGQPWRLPTEDEWERAASGDGRRYPWGDRFDASFCKMRQSRAGAAAPEPPGAFALDQAPSGARDLAGGIADWVIPSTPGADLAEGSGARVVVSRGGAWCDWEADCLLAARRSYLANERSTRVGFRLVRSV